MSKRLVMCCDGTWNKPDELSKGVLAPTNVAKVALGIARRSKTPQLVYYQPGVGTGRFDHVRGGAFGHGLSRNVRACYRFIVDTYEEGDELYFFGFSRGAYTARSTVGLIHNCGILRPEHRDRLDEAYRLYRSRDPVKKPRQVEAKLFRGSYSYDEESPEIRFVGVWDTVGALGIPIPVPRFIKRNWSFHDTELNDRVVSAHQALAIDERRRPFKPTLWKRKDKPKGQTLEQVWFAGAHRDVGGGTRDSSLSEIPLLWMVRRARACGLEFKPDRFVETSAARMTAEQALERRVGRWLDPDAHGPIDKSFKGLYRVLGWRVRKVGANSDGALDEQFAASTAVARRRFDRTYQPRNLKKAVKHHIKQVDVLGDVKPAPAGRCQGSARARAA